MTPNTQNHPARQDPEEVARHLWEQVQIAVTDHGDWLMGWDQAPQAARQAVLDRSVALFIAGSQLMDEGMALLGDVLMAASAAALVEVARPLVLPQN